MTIIQTMTAVGLLGLALHLGFYWAALGLAVLFALCVWAKRAKASSNQKK
jgi:hypothetical protein